MVKDKQPDSRTKMLEASEIHSAVEKTETIADSDLLKKLKIFTNLRKMSKNKEIIDDKIRKLQLADLAKAHKGPALVSVLISQPKKNFHSTKSSKKA